MFQHNRGRVSWLVGIVGVVGSKPMAEGSPASVPGTPPQTGHPPFGSTSAVGPTPNRGMEAAGLQKLAMVLKQLEELVPMFGAGSDPGKDVLQALTRLSKHVPAGSSSPASERDQIQQMAMRNTQQNQMLQAVRQGQQSPGAGAQTPQAA